MERHRVWWVALILFMASNAFVWGVGKTVPWEFGVEHGRTADFCRWDCVWFQSVVDEGYDREPGRQGFRVNWVDFPLFPLFATPLRNLLHLSSALALIVVSKCTLYASILFFMLMVRDELNSTHDYIVAGSLVAFNPYIIYAHVGYSEPLYFALGALGFFLLRKNRRISSGVAGAFLSATRMVGCLFALSYLIAQLKRSKCGDGNSRDVLTVFLGLLLCPVGVAIYSLYLYHHTGDALGFLHAQIGWGRETGNPFAVLVHSLREHGWLKYWALTAAVGLAASGWLFWRRQTEMAVFLAGAILVPLCADTMCMPRYVWWQPPFLYAIFTVLKRYPSWYSLYFWVAGGIAAIMTILWFSNSGMVI
jgi:hypothetical protein